MWRVAHGRVLVRLIDGRAYELTGDAAAVWLACDEPADAREVETRIAPRPVNDLGANLELLLVEGLLQQA